jgi:hypothetical protein
VHPVVLPKSLTRPAAIGKRAVIHVAFDSEADVRKALHLLK